MIRIIIGFIILIFSLSVLAFAEPCIYEPLHDKPTAGNSVYISTGEFYQETTDLTIPGVGMPFKFTRKYRSNNDNYSTLGYGWDFIYNQMIVTDTGATYFDGMGRANEFPTHDGNWNYPPPDGLYVNLKYFPVTDSFSLTETNGAVYIFGPDPGGYGYYVLTSITDRNNNQMTLSYDNNDCLINITDTLNRVITFTYITDSYGYFYLEHILDGSGRSITYEYDNNWNLWKVTSPATADYPNGNTTIYGYNENYLITQVTDPNGNTYIQNQYENGKVISQTYGSDFFTFVYTDATPNSPAIVNVTDRNGNETEYCMTPQGNVSKRIQYKNNIMPNDVITLYEHITSTERSVTILPNGNSIEYTYAITSTDPRVRGNLTQVTRRTSEDETLTTIYTYETHYNLVKTITDPKGNTTTFLYDYEDAGPDKGNVVKITYPTVTLGLCGTQAISAIFTYNSYGQLLTATNPENNVDSYEYSNGYLQTIHRDLYGENITNSFAYDSIGNITVITDGRGHATTFTVNELNQVITTTSRLGYNVGFSYDQNDNLYQVRIQNKDKDGNYGTPAWLETNYYYNSLDNVTAISNQVASGQYIGTSFGYDDNENRNLITQPVGNQVLTTYDERDFIYEIKRGYGTTDESTTTFNYDSNGNRTSVTNNSHTTTYTFDGFDRCTKITDALGNYTDIAYDDNGNITRITRKDSSNTTLMDTQYLYDQMNRCYEIQQYKDGWITTLQKEFDRNSRVITVRDANNKDTKAYYDGLGRVIKTEDHVGNKVEYILDANSNIITATEYAKNITGTFITYATTFEYDNLDRLIRTISPISVIRDYYYDSRNNPTHTVDGEGNTIENTYDGINRLLTVEKDITDNGKGTGSITDTIITQYIWDDNSRLYGMIDHNGHTVTYTYNTRNLKTQELYADGEHKDFTYDLADNITYYTDPNGSGITQTFDDINRLTNRSITPGSGVVGVTSESYTYDGLSRMLTAYNSYSTVTFGYDTMSRMLTEQQQLSGFSARTATSAYNNVGFRTQLTYPSNKIINLVPDAVNRLTNVQDVSYNNIAQYQYVGYRVEEHSYLNNTKLTVNYDDNGRVITYSHGASIAGFAYGYDNEDNKLFEKRTHGTKGDAYVYDSIYRATGVKYGVPNTELDPLTTYDQYMTFDSIEQFNLDGVGNRLNVYNGVTTTYTTNNLNEYTNISGTDLTYDDNGNLTGDGTYTYSYDYANRLIEVKEGETSIATFKYDALGRRIEKVSANGTIHYYYDGARVIEERNGNDSDSLQKSYTHGNRIDELLTMETITGTYYYHENSLGSIYAVTDGDGNVVERYEYTIYGIPIFFDATGTEISGTAISNNYLYTGREYDPEIGLYNYRARYYSPELGRFLGRDPIGYVDGMNLYEYVQSNPMSFIDPYGLSAKSNAAETPFLSGMSTTDYWNAWGKNQSEIEKLPKSTYIPPSKSSQVIFAGLSAAGSLLEISASIGYFATDQPAQGAYFLNMGLYDWHFAWNNLMSVTKGGPPLPASVSEVMAESITSNKLAQNMIIGTMGGFNMGIGLMSPVAKTGALTTVPSKVVQASARGKIVLGKVGTYEKYAEKLERNIFTLTKQNGIL